MAVQFSRSLLKQCWFLTGPTASGKSEVAVQLATRLTGNPAEKAVEIVSLDSMALYRGMNIGTAKPSADQQQQAPHHLIDLLDPHEEFSLAEYVSSAREICEQIVNRGNRPLFVGGTGLYLRGILRGVFEGPVADWGYRRELEVRATQEPPTYLHDQLGKVDAAAANSLHPNDTRRIIRALEVHHVTGRPLSEQQKQGPLAFEDRPPHVYWISPQRNVLYDRINSRVERMLAEGLFEEVKTLLELPQPISRTARQALGYKEVVDAIEGNRPLSECADTIKTRTRQFAKRQHTWFRNLVECHELEIADDESPKEIVRRLLSIIHASETTTDEEM